MADSKITALTSIGASTDPANDPLVIVDVSDTSMAASGTTKKVTLNNLLACSPTATLASATITGDLTVRTNKLFVNATGVGINYTSPAVALHLGTTSATNKFCINTAVTGGGDIQMRRGSFIGFSNAADNANSEYLFANGGALEFGLSGSTAMTLNSTGLGVGVASPSYNIHARGTTDGRIQVEGASGYGMVFIQASSGNTAQLQLNSNGGSGRRFVVASNSSGQFLIGDETAVQTRLLIDSSGNVGVGVTPSAWATSYKAFQIGQSASLSGFSSELAVFGSNCYFDTTDSRWERITSGYTSQYYQTSGTHVWRIGGTAGANTDCSFTTAMTLDASGNLLVGTTSAAGGRLWIQSAGSTAGVEMARFTSSAINNSFIVYVTDAEGFNAGATAVKVGRNATTSRSINAGGTVNASGADYAEYMVKCGDFVLAKGDVAGIDANGKLTNVFADAVSFVVKSTDPSYVGNDKWGVDLEGDALEAARQLVDRVAFAGQVPVNVTGATTGDYIVPVVDGIGIKGISVSNPTFEQYQLAVGKVISIDADGRARIIVKVA